MGRNREAPNPCLIFILPGSRRPRRWPGEPTFTLTPEECAELFHEGTLYYYPVSPLVPDERLAAFDARYVRNLRFFDFVHHYAEREEDQMYLEQWRPYLIRMNAMAETLYALETDQHDDAMRDRPQRDRSYRAA